MQCDQEITTAKDTATFLIKTCNFQKFALKPNGFLPNTDENKILKWKSSLVSHISLGMFAWNDLNIRAEL